MKIMSKNTSMTLGSYFDQFIQRILREGRYKNTNSEYHKNLGVPYPKKDDIQHAKRLGSRLVVL